MTGRIRIYKGRATGLWTVEVGDQTLGYSSWASAYRAARRIAYRFARVA